MAYRLEVTLTTYFTRLRDVCVINDTEMEKKMEILQAAQDSLKARQ